MLWDLCEELGQVEGREEITQLDLERQKLGYRMMREALIEKCFKDTNMCQEWGRIGRR